ncbi:T9SS type A sorting domain-containing protein [Pontimicrobium aquaticum]|uniref:T9SS type A sorting domain-containing protein n=1 Tax=Pontimicrobium aquaticum TaxID=2565367 RepID=UPI00145F9179|nr:T9SS type A sorting domain-containing protein [Pontimicrobium aquaticum]
MAISALFNNENGTESGHVRVYDLSALLSLDDYVLSKFSLEPNPAKTHFNIHLKDNIELIKANIYNNLGQLVKEDNKENIKVSSFSKGIYFVEIITNKGKASKKIIIE